MTGAEVSSAQTVDRPLRRAVVAATVLLAAVLAGWSLLTPVYRGADEPMHVSTSLRLAESGTYPAPGRAQMQPSVLGSFYFVQYYGFSGRRPVSVQEPRFADAPSMDALADPSSPHRAQPAIDQMTQHPPLYYLLLAGVIRLLHLDGLGPVGFVLTLRLVSGLLLLPVPWLCALAARRAGLAPRAAAVAAFLPASWMQFVDTSAGVNNGTLLVLLTSVVGALVVPVTRGDVGARRALLVGVAVGLALLTKGFALALLPVVVVAYLVGARHGGVRRSAQGCLVAVAASGIGLWWWVVNVVRYGQVQPKGTTDPPPVDVVPPVSQWVGEFSDIWMRTMWVAIGWAEGTPPRWLYQGATIALAVLVLLGTLALWRRLGLALVLHLLWLGPLAIVALGSYEEFQSSGVTRGAQGRYVQTAVLAFAVLVAAALARLRPLLPVVPLLVTVAAVGGTGYGLLHFWRPVPSRGEVQGGLLAAGSWLPGGTTGLVAALVVAVVAGLAGCVLVQRTASRVDAPLPDPPATAGRPPGRHAMVG